VSDEKLSELLGLQAEHPELDFKQIIDPGTTRGLIQLARHVGAMSVAGGYLVGGVDDHAVPTGAMDGFDARLFDEAALTSKLRRYLPDSVAIRSRVTQRDDHIVVVIYVAPHPNGYAIFLTDGQFRDARGRDSIAFRAGEAFWRDGTSSVRISQTGMEQVISRRISAAKSEWMEEQQAIRRREREEMEAGNNARNLAMAPLGTLHFGLAADELRLAVLEILRAGDRIALLHLLNDAKGRASLAASQEDTSQLVNLLDKIAVLATDAIQFGEDDLFSRLVALLARIYSMPLGPHDDLRFGMTTSISPKERAPGIFLAVIERIYSLGALAVRLNRWEDIRILTLQRPERMDNYWKNWLRHALTMGSRAGHFEENTDSGQTVQVSLLTRVAAVIDQVPALHPDTSDSEAILTSLTQFDFLANLTAIDGTGSLDTSVYYTNWARFRQERIQSIADRVLAEPELRQAIFRDHGDAFLAKAFSKVGEMARTEGFRYDGFRSWEHTPVGTFISAEVGE
jgi:hypothetical protein